MDSSNHIFVLISTFIISFILYKLLIPYFKKVLIDIPNHRSSHLYKTPTAGGIIFTAITFLFAIIEIFRGQSSFLITLPFLSLPLIVISFIDDFKNLPISYRFSSQILASSILVIIFLNEIEFLPIHIRIILFPFLLFSSVATINLINFMDGLDGLISGSFFIILITISLKHISEITIFALIGSLLAFIFFNWSPAKIFMGDIGSTFLAYMYLGIILQNNNVTLLFSNILIATPIFADSIFCLIRRKIAGHNIFEPHKLHLYQRLQQAGLSHSNVSLIYIIGVLLLAITYYFGNLYILIILSLIEIYIGYLFDKFLAKSFSKSLHISK